MSTQPILERLDSLIKSNICAVGIDEQRSNAVIAAMGAPSVSIAVLDDGAISSSCISTIGNDTETLFQAASISKTLMSTTTMRLVDLGRLKIDDKVSKYLAEDVLNSIASPHHPTRPLLELITVRHLLSHTAGLNNMGFRGYDPDRPIPSNRALLAGGPGINTKRLSIESFPGLAFRYSGGGCQLLQMVIENVTNQAYAEVVGNLVLKPLGMSRSCYTLPENERNFTTAHYNGYTECRPSYHILPEHAAGGLWTTPSDLTKLIQAVQNSLVTPEVPAPGSDISDGQATFLKRKTAEEMLTVVDEDMALAWFANHAGFSHTGWNLPGYSSFYFGYADLKSQNLDADKDADSKKRAELDSLSQPPSKSGVAVMANSADGFPVIWGIVAAICYLKGWPAPPTLSSFDPETTPFIDYAAKVDQRWTDWIGVWNLDQDPWEHDWVIQANDKGEPVVGLREKAKSEGSRDGGDDVTMMKLRVAALPQGWCFNAAGEKVATIDLVVEGLSVMLRLRWDEKDPSKRAIEVLNRNAAELDTMHLVETK